MPIPAFLSQQEPARQKLMTAIHNFTSEEAMPLAIVQQLIDTCTPVNVAAVIVQLQADKKKKKS